MKLDTLNFVSGRRGVRLGLTFAAPTLAFDEIERSLKTSGAGAHG